MKTWMLAAALAGASPARAATEWMPGEVLERDSELIVQTIEVRR